MYAGTYVRMYVPPSSQGHPPLPPPPPPPLLVPRVSDSCQCSVLEQVVAICYKEQGNVPSLLYTSTVGRPIGGTGACGVCYENLTMRVCHVYKILHAM